MTNAPATRKRRVPLLWKLMGIHLAWRLMPSSHLGLTARERTTRATSSPSVRMRGAPGTLKSPWYSAAGVPLRCSTAAAMPPMNW